MSIRTVSWSNGWKEGLCGLTLLDQVDGWVHVCCLEQDAFWGKRQDGGGSVMTWAMFCWEILGLGINADVTLT